MTKMNIYYSFCSILRAKGALPLLNIITKRSTPFTQKGVPKITKMNIYYSFGSICLLLPPPPSASYVNNHLVTISLQEGSIKT